MIVLFVFIFMKCAAQGQRLIYNLRSFGTDEEQTYDDLVNAKTWRAAVVKRERGRMR